MSSEKKFRIQNGLDVAGEVFVNGINIVGADGVLNEASYQTAVQAMIDATVAQGVDQGSIGQAVDKAVSDLADAAPATLDTLNELAAALGDDANFATSMTNALNTKLNSANNLSDVADAAAARSNLGLGTAATAATTSFATAAQGAKADAAATASDLTALETQISSGVATLAQGAKADTAVQPENFFTVADGTTTSYVADWSQPMGVVSTLTPTGVSNRAKYIVDLSKSVDGKTIAIYGTRKGEWVGGYLNNDNDAVQHWAVAWDENGNHIHTYDMGVDTLPDNIHLGHDAKRYVSADITDTHIFIASGSWGGYRAYEISDPTVLVASSNLSMSISASSMKARIRVIDDKIISTSSGSQYYTGNFQVRTWADGNMVYGNHLTWNGNAGEWQADKETGWVYIADTQGQAKGYNFKTMTSGATIPNGAKSIGVGNKYMVTSDGDTYNEIIDAKVYLVGTNTEVATLVRPSNVFFWGANPIMYQGNSASYGEAVILTGRPQNTSQNTHYVFDMSSANPSTHVKTINGNGQWSPNTLQINSKHSVQKTTGAVQSYSGEPTTAVVTNILGPVTEVVTPNVDASTIASKVYVDNAVANADPDLSSYPNTTEMATAIATAKTEAQTYADGAVADAIDAAPAGLDTLNELAAALNDDANFASTMTTSLASKADDAATTTALATKADQTDLDTLETFVKGSAYRGSERLNSISSGQWDWERSGAVTNNGALTVFSRQGGEPLVARKQISGLQVGKTYQVRTSGEAGGNIYITLNTVGQMTYSGNASSSTKVPFIGSDIHNHDVANGLNQFGSNGTSTGDVLTDLGTSFIAPATSVYLHVVASDLNPADHNIYDISVTEYEPAPTLETSSSTILESVNELHTEIDALTVAVASTADSTAVVDAIATSKSEAIATASADATAKADQAETDAKAYADQVVAATVDAAPAALDTLNELAAALGDDANFASTVTASIATKADDAATTAALATKASQDDLTAETTRATSAETINNQAIAILQNQVSGISTSSGSTDIEMQANVDMATNKISNLGTPTSGTDAATKAYVDSGVAGVDLSGYSTTAEMNTAIANVSVDLSGYSTTTEMNSAITTEVANVVDAAPAALDTLNELAAALGDDANFASTVTSSIATKADDAATTAALATKADASAMTTALATKADDAATTSALATKATVTDVDAINTLLGKTEVAYYESMYSARDLGGSSSSSHSASQIGFDGGTSADTLRTSIHSQISSVSGVRRVEFLNNGTVTYGFVSPNDITSSTQYNSSMVRGELVLTTNGSNVGTGDPDAIHTNVYGTQYSTSVPSSQQNGSGVVSPASGHWPSFDTVKVYDSSGVQSEVTYSEYLTGNGFDSTGQPAGSVSFDTLSSTVSGAINELHTELNALSGTDTTLTASITANADAITANSNAISAETIARTAAISAETTARESAVTSAISTASSDATTKADAAEADAIATASADATSKANAAQSAAVSTASSDATAKANAAQSAAEATASADATTKADAAQAAAAVDATTKSDAALVSAQTYADNAASTAVANVIDAAPASLDTLNELAAALGDDANFASTMTNSLATKANTADVATAAQGVKADSALQPGDAVSLTVDNADKLGGQQSSHFRIDIYDINGNIVN